MRRKPPTVEIYNGGENSVSRYVLSSATDIKSLCQRLDRCLFGNWYYSSAANCFYDVDNYQNLHITDLPRIVEEAEKCLNYSKTC